MNTQDSPPDLSPPKHILFVDDDEGMLFLVRRILQRNGFIVTAFESAEEALAAFQHDPSSFDLVLSDYNMPRMNGLDLSVLIRKVHPSAVIALISGYITDELIQKAGALGIDKIIYKPNTVEELCATVRQILDETDSKALAGKSE
ncbi:MAG: response regulator [Fimbriimonas sp.]